MVVQHNMTAANANRMLGNIVGQQAKSTEKLSSGYRINRAGDDAAGLAISEKMRGQIRGLNQASTNAQDGISLIQTAEGALSESQSILQRMRELSVQAANGTETDDDRAEIQKEVNQLTSELNRIGNTTEFNTMSLLKGNTKAASVTESDITTLKEAEVVDVVGSVGNFQVKAESKVAEASTTTLIGASSQTTGKATNISVRKQGVEAEKATGDALGIKFETTDGGTELNGTKVIIKADKDSETDAAAYDAGAKTLTFTLTDETIDTITTVSDLNSKLGELLADNDGAGAAGIAITQFKTKIPEGTDSTADISDRLSTLVNDTTKSETVTLSGGTEAIAGKYTFKLENEFSEVGDTITVAGYTFSAKAESDTAVITDAQKNAYTDAKTTYDTDTGKINKALEEYDKLSSVVLNDNDKAKALGTNAVALKTAMDAAGIETGDDTYNSWNEVKDAINAKQTEVDNDLKDAQDTYNALYANSGSEFRLGKVTNEINKVGTQSRDIADLLASKIASDTKLDVGKDFTVTAKDDGTITIQELTDKAAGKIILDNTVTTSGFGGDEELTITDELGQNLQINLVQQDTPENPIEAPSAAYDVATGTAATGTITITLSSSAGVNTAEAIQKAIRDLATTAPNDLKTDKIDVSKFTVSATNEWDDKADGSMLNKGWATMTGGTKEVKGEYSFNLSNKMAASETLTIGGQTFTAVESGADATKGEFNVGATIDDQLNNLQNAMNKNEEFSKYDISFTGSIVTLKEKNASGVDLTDEGMAVKATGVAGEFAVDMPEEILKDGASIEIDGEKIDVSSKNAHVGYDKGTAIKEAETVADQTQAIADAINKNEALSAKYTASVGDDGKLLLTQKEASEDAPTVVATTSTKGDLDITFQVGANSNQSMTISIQDNRALALGVSGDGSSSTVMAANGNVASYTEVQTVNNGSDNENIEYALDISSYDKATAAISVIDDALSSISSQRASLGAYQNRLEHTISNLENTSENLQTAESNIRDVDMASEMVNYSKNNILQQAAQSMLAQANQANQGVLSLLR